MKRCIVFLIICFHSMCSSKPFTIAFFIQHLSFRGTEIATYDYAHYNETMLNNRSVIINWDVYTHNAVRDRFSQRFDNRLYDCSSWEQVDEVIIKESVDLLYIIKPCTVHPRYADGRVTHVCKTALHLVFPWPTTIKGDVYAHISDWMAHVHKGYSDAVVPHMVYLTDEKSDLRDELSIPQDALVFGRHGGEDTFDVPFAAEVVTRFAKAHPHIYFLFLNTPEFCSLPNVIYLPKTTDLVYKTKFINSCDAMVHARWLGETFGLACAEFSILNKPVITWTGSPQKAHIQILGPKGIYYTTADDLYRILETFQKQPNKNWDMHSGWYQPEPVMNAFDTVFIKPFKQEE